MPQEMRTDPGNVFLQGGKKDDFPVERKKVKQMVLKREKPQGKCVQKKKESGRVRRGKSPEGRETWKGERSCPPCGGGPWLPKKRKIQSVDL